MSEFTGFQKGCPGMQWEYPGAAIRQGTAAWFTRNDEAVEPGSAGIVT